MDKYKYFMVILWYELKTKVSFCQSDQIMSQDSVNTQHSTVYVIECIALWYNVFHIYCALIVYHRCIQKMCMQFMVYTLHTTFFQKQYVVYTIPNIPTDVYDCVSFLWLRYRLIHFTNSNKSKSSAVSPQFPSVYI